MIKFVRNNEGAPVWLITIYEDEIMKEVDGITRKYTEAVEKEKSVLRADTISSDREENLDGGLVSRYISKWDAALRMRLRFCLYGPMVIQADDIEPEKPARKYSLKLGKDFDGNMLPPIETMIHNYLLSGAIYEWYKSMGIGLAETYFQEASEMQDKITFMLRGNPSTTRPLRPFGPPYPKTPLI